MQCSEIASKFSASLLRIENQMVSMKTPDQNGVFYMTYDDAVLNI